MPSAVLAKLRFSQPSASAAKTSSATGGGSSVLATLRKAAATPQAAAPTASKTTPTPIAAGPRISVLQKSQADAAKPTIRQATPAEVKNMNDPAYRANAQAAADATSEAKQREAANNAPAELHQFVAKTLPNIRAAGQRMVDTADAIAAKTGLSATGSKAAGNTILKSADVISDTIGRIGKLTKSNSLGEAAHNMIDAGIGLFNLGAISFTAASEGLGTVPVVGQPAKNVVEKGIGTVMEAGSAVLGNAYAGYHEMFTRSLSDPNFANPLAINPNDTNLATAKELGGIATLLLGAKVLHSASTAFGREVRSGDPTYAAARALGLPIPVSPGTDFKLTNDQVNSRFETMVKEAEGDQQKVDALTVAHQILTDKIAGNVDGMKKWEQTASMVPKITEQAMEAAQQTVDESSQASDLHTAIAAKDVSASTRAAAKTRLMDDQAGRLAFEHEVFVESTKNDAERTKTAGQNGATFERDQLSTSDQPAGYQDGRIIFNDHAIQNIVNSVFDNGEGKSTVKIKTGEGATTSFKEIVKEPGESPAEFRQKLEDQLFDHELAHHVLEMKSPEITAMRQQMEAAQKTGNDIVAEKLRKQLETMAHTDVKITRTKIQEPLAAHETSAIDNALQTFQNSGEIRARREALKYDDAGRETAYESWKKATKMQDRLNMDWEGLKKSLKNPDLLKRIDDGLKNGETNNELLDSFRERAAKEAKLREDIAIERARRAEAKSKQGEMFPKNKKGELRRGQIESIRKIAKEEVHNVSDQKIEDLKRKGEMQKLRQRIEDRYRLEKQRAVSAALREKIATGKASQQEISDFLRQNRVPYEVRGKFITDLKNAKTPADTAAVVMEIKKEFNEYQRKKSVDRIEGLIKQAQGKDARSPVDAQTQGDIALVKGYMKMTRAEIGAKIEKLVTDARAQIGEDGLLPPDVARKIELLEMGGLEQQTARQTLRTEAQLRSIINTGKTLHEAKIEAQMRRVTQLVESTSEKLTGSKDFNTKVNPEKVGKTVFQKIARHLGDKVDRWQLVNELAAKLGKPMEDVIGRATHAVAEGKRQYNRIKIAALDKFATEYGKDFQLNADKNKTEQIDFGKMRMADGSTETIRYTRNQMIDIYNRAREAGGTEILTSPKGNNLTTDILKKIEDTLTPKEKAIADYIVNEIYKPQIDPLQKAAAKHDDILVGDRKGYAGPRRYVEENIDETKLEGMSALQIVNENAKYHISNRPGFIRSAKDPIRPLAISDDPLAAALRYSENAQHYIHVGSYAKELTATLSDPRFTGSVENQLGENFLRTFKDQVKDIQQPRSDDFGKPSTLTKATNNVAAYLVNRQSVAVGQFSQIPGGQGYAAKLGISGMDYWKGVFNAKKNEAILLKYVPEIELRFNEPMPGTGAGLRLAIGSKAELLNERFKKLGARASFVEWADKFSARATANGIFEPLVEKFQKQGNSLERSRYLAGVETGRVLNESQPSNLNIAKGAAFKQPGVRDFLSLKQAGTKIALATAKTVRQVRNGEITKTQGIKAIAYTLVLQQAAYELTKRAYSTVRDVAVGEAAGALGFKNVKDAKLASARSRIAPSDVAKGLGLAEVSGATGVPILGDILQVAIQNLALDKNYEYRPLIIDALLSDFMSTLTSLRSGKLSKAGLYAMRTAFAASGATFDPVDLLGQLIAVPAIKQKMSEMTPAEQRTARAENAKKTNK